ncbi:MAG: hypothetical protein AAGG08_13520 [Actinomycetota bacterium]
MRTPPIAAAACAALLVLSACGSDGDDPAGSDDSAGTADEATDLDESSDGDDSGEADVDADGGAEADGDAATESDCPATSGSFESADGATLSPTSALAARILGGEAYTIYLADRPLAPDEVSFVAGPTAEADEVIVTMAITTFNAEGPVEPVVAGETVEYTPDFGVRTFVVTADVGGTLLGDSTDGEGTTVVSQVDGRFCAEVTYSDGQKSLTAVIDAEIVDI